MESAGFIFTTVSLFHEFSKAQQCTLVLMVSTLSVAVEGYRVLKNVLYSATVFHELNAPQIIPIVLYFSRFKYTVGWKIFEKCCKYNRSTLLKYSRMREYSVT